VPCIQLTCVVVGEGDGEGWEPIGAEGLRIEGVMSPSWPPAVCVVISSVPVMSLFCRVGASCALCHQCA
jgi:hypothetical protein